MHTTQSNDNKKEKADVTWIWSHRVFYITFYNQEFIIIFHTQVALIINKIVSFLSVGAGEKCKNQTLKAEFHCSGRELSDGFKSLVPVLAQRLLILRKGAAVAIQFIISNIAAIVAAKRLSRPRTSSPHSGHFLPP
jgi:hypothetical protein